MPFVVCGWCGRTKKVRTRQAEVCSPKCRLRRFRFVRETGFYPEEPPGDKTASAALKELIQWLLLAEKRRLELKRARA